MWQTLLASCGGRNRGDAAVGVALAGAVMLLQVARCAGRSRWLWHDYHCKTNRRNCPRSSSG